MTTPMLFDRQITHHSFETPTIERLDDVQYTHTIASFHTAQMVRKVTGT